MRKIKERGGFINIYAVRSDEEDFLEVFSSLESAIDCGISLIEDSADRYLGDDDDIEEIIENFRKYESTNMLDFDISIYRLTLDE